MANILGGADKDLILTPDNPLVIPGYIRTPLATHGADSIDGRGANDYIMAGGGNDGVFGEAGNDRLFGEAGDDTLGGGDGNDVLEGGAGNDTLTGGAGADALNGGAGGDKASYASASTAVIIDLALGTTGGAAAGDTYSGIEHYIGTGFADTIAGGGANEIIEGLIGNDTLSGGDGDDVVNGGDGDDTIHGGAGNDFLRGRSLGLNPTTEGFDAIYGGAGDDTINLLGSRGGLAFGGDGNDIITGTYYAGDHMVGGAGADTFAGVSNMDTVDYTTNSTGISVDFSYLYANPVAHGGEAEGDEFVLSPVGGYAIIGSHFADDIKAWIAFGGNGNDTLAVAGLGARFSPGRLDGGAGTDSLTGSAGDDVLTGGTGADTIAGGAGADTASYATSAVGVTVSLTTGIGSGGDAQGDTLSGIENLEGSAFADTMFGDAGANTLTGLGGNDLMAGEGGDDVVDGGAGNDKLYGGSDGIDILQGGDGDDFLTGGTGPDQLFGGAGIDTAYYNTSTTAVSVVLGPLGGTGGEANGDTYTGVENVVGSNFDDTLRGDTLANRLTGLAGDDRLVGGGGADTLQGGAGADRFVYEVAADSPPASADKDRILDFSSVQGDRIDLSAMDALPGTAGDQAFTFVGAGMFTGAGGEVRAQLIGAVTLVQGDINGDRVADFAINVTKLDPGALAASDFVL